MAVKRIQTKRYWYFVTQDFMGHEMCLEPRRPHSAGSGEPTIKRICVAPTAAHCMSAIYLSQHEPIYVYRTARRLNATKAWDVIDASITGEHFLLRKTKFEFVASLSAAWVNEMHTHGCFDSRCGSKGSYEWKDQLRGRRTFARSLRKFDTTLAYATASDVRVKKETEQKLLGWLPGDDLDWERKVLGLEEFDLDELRYDRPLPDRHIVTQTLPLPEE